ncbi:MAG: hypothetical protein JWP75_836 [Frondihabitans sp.]|nr:hypothetical protein [Frondihabitans sp.]
MTLDTAVGAKQRDAAKTRHLLLQAARQRFAYDGYSATTVRDIANDAGVNVALINRYFGNKVGLFAACLERVVEELDRPEESRLTLERMVESLVTRVADLPSGEHPLELLLLIRTSGDEQADRIRRDTLNSYTERMAAVVGWSADDPSTRHLLLRAQIAIATAFGIALLRSSTGLEPLASATAADLAGPLGEVVTGLLRSDSQATPLP